MVSPTWCTRLLSVALLATAAATPAGHAAAASRMQTEWVRYTSDFSNRGALLAVTGSVRSAPGAFFAIVDVDGPASNPVALFPVVVDLEAATTANVYGVAGDGDLCAGPLDCHMQGGVFTFTDRYTIERGTRAHISEYLIFRGLDVKLHESVVRGWTAQHRAGGVTRRTVGQAGGLGVNAYGTVIDAGSTTATARGPAGGSIAIAVPGCDELGRGSVRLTGGIQHPVAHCPAEPIAAVARHATTWAAAGSVTGIGRHTTRLLVIHR